MRKFQNIVKLYLFSIFQFPFIFKFPNFKIDKSMKNERWQMANSQRGFSLFEILVVIFLFALVIAIANQAFFSALRGNNKSEAQTTAKQNAHYILSVMERSLHSAQNVSSCTQTNITYYNSVGAQETFDCSQNRITQSGSPISSSSVSVASCNFSCLQEGGKKSVIINITVAQAGTNLRVDEAAQVQVSTRIRLRN